MQKQYVGVGVLVLVVVAAGWYFLGSKEPKAAPVVTPAPGTPATTTDVATSSAEESRATQVTNAENVLPPTTDADTPTRTDAEIERNIAELGYTMNDVTVYRDEKLGFEFYYPKEATLQELIPITGRDQTHIEFCSDNELSCEASISYGVNTIWYQRYVDSHGKIENIADYEVSGATQDVIKAAGIIALRYTRFDLASEVSDTVRRIDIYSAMHNSDIYRFEISYSRNLDNSLVPKAKQFDDLFRATFRFIESAN
jgi:hypothetical protein